LEEIYAISSPEKKAENTRVIIIPIKEASMYCGYTMKDTNSRELKNIMPNIPPEKCIFKLNFPN
jgi:hypothetical protein